MKRILAIVGLALGAASLAAQQPADAVFARARQLVVSGNGSAGRLLIDSVLSATPATSPVYGDALYWRAALAATSPDAERDYLRLVVEYPSSPHVGDGLLQLAQLESARGDRAAATTHLGHFLSDFPQHGERTRAVLLYVRLLLEQNELPRGCSVLKQTLAELPETAIETRNQLEYYLPRCMASDVSRGGAVPLGPPGLVPADPQYRDSLKADTTTKTKPKNDSGDERTAAVKGRFTLQVAAYKAKRDAEALVKRLQAKKIDARVVSSASLHRVQVGRYPTRAAAVAAQKALKARKIDAFVTDVSPGEK